MAFNKNKALESALKFLNQGKVPQAIGEYQQILRQDPKDQATLMTVGDLFARQGDMPQAIEYFERLAQVYLNDGFNSKAIAIYKKIAKLAPAELAPLERLGEPRDIAAVVAFLAGPDGSWINGQVLRANGGII